MTKERRTNARSGGELRDKNGRLLNDRVDQGGAFHDWTVAPRLESEQ